MDSALGFLEALHEHGAIAVVDTKVEMAGPMPTSPTAQSSLQKRILDRKAVRELWTNAVEVHSRTMAMEAVIDAKGAESSVAYPASPTPSRATRRSL